MKPIVWMSMLLVTLSLGRPVAAQQEAAGDTFLGLLRTGQQVALGEAEGGGYYLAVGETLPTWVGVGTAEAAVAQAEAVRRLLAQQYQEVLEANRRVPNAIPEQTVERLRVQLAQQTQAVQQARLQAARPDVWEVSAVGDDYIGLRSGNLEMRIPLASIRAIVQQTAPEKAKPAAKQ